MNDAVLVMENLCKRFPGAKGGVPVEALRDFSLTVGEGEFVCILGRSGCGKSTLLGVIAGFIEASSGTVACNGVAVSGPDRHRMLMFQDASLFPWLDVMGNVLYGLRFVEGLTAAEKRERADTFLQMVGLGEFKRFRVHELSGGMRQRVALARALAPDPDILMMDEPFSALDAMTREQLYFDIQNIWRTTRKTMIMVTHNVREAACLGTRAVLMAPGGRILTDTPISLPHPRSMNDESLAKMAAHISSFLQNGGTERVS